MKKLERLKSMSLILFVAFLGGTWGAQRAHADTVSEFTGTWETGPSGYGSNQDESSSGPAFFNSFGADGSHVGFFLAFPVTAGTLRPDCAFYGSCAGPVAWSGTFVGGIMNMYIDTDAFGPTFTATITGGSYSGFTNSLVYPDDESDDEQTFTFTGQWPNGWTSVGTFTGGYGEDEGTHGGFGTLTMTTTTAPTTVPEPGSITLLGTGMVLVAASLRRKLRSSSPVL
jgi:PEP-CTERM motif